MKRKANILFFALLVVLPLFTLGLSLQVAASSTAAPEILVPGSILAFQSKRDGNWEVYSGYDDGTGQTRLTAKGSIDSYPRFNRGCTAIAFTSSRDVNNLNIWKMNPDGSGLAQLTTHQSDEYNPAWSPNGTRIAFVSERNGLPDIYVMNNDGSAQTRLTLDPAQDVDPAWSPDGNWLAFASNRAGGFRIWKMDPAGGNLTLLSGQTNSRNPAWSPDGTRIAYDADADGDGRKELWVMNADGSNQQLVYDPGSVSEDIWVRSWSPDGRYIAFTHLWGYQDPQTWTAAILQAWDTYNPGTIVTLIDSGLDWHPDWQTTDTWAPTSSVLPLASLSPATFTVSWSGYDNGPAGLRHYDIQVQDNGGPWVDWLVGTTATAMPYTGVGGHTYAFRSRARDNAYNVEPYPEFPDAATTVESAAPGTSVAPLPDYYRGTQFWVSWSGIDPGGSGIAFYDVQSRDLTAGTGWADWRTGTTDTGATFSGISGHRYAFRSRGTDYAQNVEPWPTGPGDAAVTLYTWAISGTIRDNRDILLAGAVVTTTPGAFETHPSDEEGAYSAYISSIAGAYYASWGRAGYGSLPPTRFAAAQDGRFDTVLPPADNAVSNWGFETGALAPEWTAGGMVAPGVTTTVRDSGNYAALLGCQRAAFVGRWNVSNMAGTSSEPQVAADGSGVVHAVWEQDNGSATLYYARRDAGGTWSLPYAVVSLPTVEAGLRAVLDGSGVLHVVWVQDEGGDQGDIYYIRRTAGGTWSGLQNISANAGDSRNPQVVVGSTGIVYVVWTDTTPGSVQIFYADTSSGSWSTPQQISNMLTGGDPPQLAVDGSGNLHVVWSDRPSADKETDIYHTWRRYDGVWGTPKNVSESVPRSESPQLVVETGGVLHVVWSENAAGQATIAYARRQTNGTWSPPLGIGSSTYALAQPRAVLDGSGVLHVVWSGSDAGTAHLFYARRAADGTWSPAEGIFEEAGVLDSLQAAVSANRTLHLVWSHDPPGALQPEIYHLRRDSDGHWSTAHNASRTTGASRSPQMAVEGNRTVHLLWTDSTPGAPAVYHAYAAFNALAGDSTISQAVAIPASSSAPTLSFLYLLDGASPTSGSWLGAQLGTDLGTVSLFSTTASINDWTHRWFDLSPWAGQTVTVILKVHQAADMLCTWGYIDEVSVGSSYADLWVDKAGPSTAVPEETVVYRLTYGNRGGVEASSVAITDTLPAGLSFVAASPLPVSPAPPLRWEVGSLPARSGPYTIVVTATVNPDTPWLSVLVNPASIGADMPEMERGNNADEVVTLVGYRVYLPLVTMQNQ